MVRLKNRYLLVQFLYPSTDSASKPSKDVPALVEFHQPSPPTLTAAVLARAIRAETGYLFGDYGAGMTSGSLVVKYLSPATSTAIIRVTRAHYRLVWAALSFMTSVPGSGKPCVVHVVKVSGTIRKAEEEAIRRARNMVLRAKKQNQSGFNLDLLTESIPGSGDAGKESRIDPAAGVMDLDDEDEDEEGIGAGDSTDED
ncbi:hypothetical protein L228DRAFT_263709 [Xylona heveae TC161]|uniref:Ribonuclease P/MRP protein subunit POP5 n=1 Tax=Xylona heveae (strain CBS 132557 / TC161) TaxID=1328760 RepID=A0A164ZQD3_XYLHT|nr:hypothetical protein L228DRAFT_263709 [Xylona heveae TC161]KZF19373.1 hypothetical protein L228DRAFT_263709 [Xylona heveae TC161]